MSVHFNEGRWSARSTEALCRLGEISPNLHAFSKSTKSENQTLMPRVLPRQTKAHPPERMDWERRHGLGSVSGGSDIRGAAHWSLTQDS